MEDCFLSNSPSNREDFLDANSKNHVNQWRDVGFEYLTLQRVIRTNLNHL